MDFIKRLFKKTHIEAISSNENKKIAVTENKPSVNNEIWKELPAYIPASTEDYRIVSLIATALAAESYPTSQFAIKKIEQRNPEVKLVSLVSSCIGAGNADFSDVTIKKILKKI